MDRLLGSLASLVFFIQILLSSSAEYSFRIFCDNEIAGLKHFWKSTGFCPPEPHQEAYKYFLSEDEKQNLALIGSIPKNGIEQVRIHWLLDLVKVESVHDSTITYNFTLLDRMVAMLHDNGLRPGFELMGNPSNWYTDFESSTQVYAWKDLVYNIAKRYIDRYGIGYVHEWNFETWNEPDHRDFDNLNFTIEGFLNYYDACSEGLRAADPSLKLGGPADNCNDPRPKHEKISWALFDHCINGINYFTKEKGVRLDYISLHLKGGGHSMTILDEELSKITEIQEKYPEYKDTIFYNDEADPLVGWSKPEWWRADATYAAVVAKVIVQHQYQMMGKNPDIRYTLLSNDNGFLNYHPNYFDQRTLVTRFQMNETMPPSIQTIKKPVLSIMGLLALLGEEQVRVKSVSGGNAADLTGSDVNVLASVHTPTKSGGADSWQATILTHNSADTDNITATDAVQLEITGIKSSFIISNGNQSGDMMYVQYLLDNAHGNPSAIWQDMGSPVYPSRALFKKMRDNQEPVRVVGPESFTSTNMTVNLMLNKPGVSLIHICAKPESGPEKVTGLRVHPVTSSDVLVIWDDGHVTCILTYEVQFSASGGPGTYKRVNDVDLIFTAYAYSPSQMKQGDGSSPVVGWYRVRAVNYWNQVGPFSDPVKLKS